MVTTSATWFLFIPIILSLCLITLGATVVQDLKNLHQPPNFNTTIVSNCLKNPSLRYCNSNPMDLDEIFKFSIVASHLCNESKNPNCVESFPKIDLRNRPNIATLYLSFGFFWKYCPLSILSIDLSNNSMKGSFPIDVLYCTQIHSLDLSVNEFSGHIPIQSFSPLTNLSFLNLSYNCFSESKLSDSQFFKRFNSSSFLHSGALLDHKRFTLNAVILLIGFPILVMLMVICLGWICFQRPDFLPSKLQRSKMFTPAILKAATDGFSNKNLVGKSDVVHIYKGILRDGTEVKIEIYLDDISMDSYHKFVKECKVLSNLNHKNLVRVLGWCRSRKFRAIITEWTKEENVEMWLSGSASPWNHRLKVIKGIIECMCYLLEEWPEIDYDLNISTVLLSDNMEPLISRFKIGDQNNNRRKIFKFGVFILEMILNRKIQEEFDVGDSGFIRYMRTLSPIDLQQIIDETMEVTETSLHQVKQVLSLGLMCIDQSNNEQPSLALIFKTIARAYKTSFVLPSANHRLFHGDRFKGSR
ncbi:putative cysteine-rich receptor-like protein kinase 35 [Abrus precatorius]|uniref:Cysteine-rich receptor-like protein kinase 35 n=1 Tax=Abrus precatorius TaxID=3816 RepID=A0A8B8L1A0_ABRPR|nr:putative cysteine-rich receptor-like protein kinase 35 [Abrus precatorius]